jgi:nucleotide-binding universal stress UspA family protein
MRVLFAVDGSSGSFEAIDQVAPLLTAGRDQVALYCRPPQVRTSGSQAQEVVTRARSALADAIVAEASKRLPPEFQSSREVVAGQHDPRHEIVTAGEKWSAELIVMGARGLSVFQRLLLGSVSRAVVHSAKVPVWIARPRPTTATFRNTLLTCEHPELAAPPAQFVSRFSWPAGSSFTMLTVCTSLVAGRVPEWLQQRQPSAETAAMVEHWVREHDVEIQTQLSQLQSVIRTLPEPLHGAQAAVVEGDPVNEILAAIVADRHDLVVVGAKHKRSIATAIFGSTSEAVIQHAHCSVLVVPFSASECSGQ